MATYIFQDIDDFKKYVGGAVNISLEMDSIKPTILDACEQHVLPWLGQATWDVLVAGVEAGDLVAPFTTLLPYVCRPLAKLTMYEYAALGGIQFGEGGIFRTETESHKSPFKYQEAQYRDSMLQHGYEALEQMQRYLDVNAASFTAWAASTAFSRTRELTINYAADFRDAYSKYISRHTFETLRSLIADVELFALPSTLGQAQYDRIKAGILAADLTDDEKALLRLLQRAVANFVVEEGVRRHWVTLDGANVVQISRTSADAIAPRTPAGADALRLNLDQADEFGNRYISQITRWLSTRLADFPLYSAYLDEMAAAEEAEEEDERAELAAAGCCTTDPNASRKAVHRL